MVKKSDIVQSAIDQLTAESDALALSLQNAREGATGDDTKAEGKYDTRGLEASYLVHGQVQRAEELAETIAKLGAFNTAALEDSSTVRLGSVVKTRTGAETFLYFVAPAGGGLEVESEDGEIMFITPASPLAKKLLEKKAGDVVGNISIVEIR